MTKVAKINMIAKKSSSFVEKPLPSSNEKPMPITTTTIIVAAKGTGMTELVPTMVAATATATRLRVGNTKGHIYGKTVLKTGGTKTAAMTILESPTKPQIKFLKVLTQDPSSRGSSEHPKTIAIFVCLLSNPIQTSLRVF